MSFVIGFLTAISSAAFCYYALNGHWYLVVSLGLSYGVMAGALAETLRLGLSSRRWSPAITALFTLVTMFAANVGVLSIDGLDRTLRLTVSALIIGVGGAGMALGQLAGCLSQRDTRTKGNPVAHDS